MALALKVWHEHESIFNMICAADFKWGEQNLIQARVAHFEEELPKLKEITTILELALWKMRMKENILQGEATHCQKKIKIDESDIRQSLVTCGSAVIIRHVLPFLITATDEYPCMKSANIPLDMH